MTELALSIVGAAALVAASVVYAARCLAARPTAPCRCEKSPAPAQHSMDRRRPVIAPQKVR